MRQSPFETALLEACACLDQFNELLEREQAAIPLASAEQIEAFAARKRQTLDRLQEIFSNSTAQPDLQQDKARIKALAESARKKSEKANTQNRTNGRMLAVHARFNDARLDSLAGAAGRPRTYGADGSLKMLRGARYNTMA